MKVIWFTGIRYDRGRHLSGDSGAAVSVVSCHVSECASPHIFAVLSVICFGLLSRGHKLGQTVFKDSIVIRFGLKRLNGFSQCKCAMTVQVHRTS